MLENKQHNNFIIIENEDSSNNFIVNIRLLTLMQILLYKNIGIWKIDKHLAVFIKIQKQSCQ